MPATRRESSADSAARFRVGDAVSWEPFVGPPRHGVVSRLKLGCVYVKSSYTNTKGRRVSRTAECFFEAHELDRLHHCDALPLTDREVR